METLKQAKLDAILSDIFVTADVKYERLPSAIRLCEVKKQTVMMMEDMICAHEVARQLLTKHQSSGKWTLQVGQQALHTHMADKVIWLAQTLENAHVDVVSSAHEKLPFKEGIFEAVIIFPGWLDTVSCTATPIQEIVRVLKPGGDLMCYSTPGRFCSITAEGLRCLFPPNEIVVHAVDVFEELRPLNSLRCVLREWSNSLPAPARQQFMGMTVHALLNTPLLETRNWPILCDLPHAQSLQLTHTPVLVASKQTTLPQLDEFDKYLDGLSSDTAPLCIEQAMYGKEATPADRRDVTLLVQARAAQFPHRFVLPTSEKLHDLFGDPFPGYPKVLSITWKRGAASGTTTACEYSGYLRTPLVI